MTSFAAVIIAVAAVLPLIGSFLVTTAFIIGARRVYCVRKKWRDVREYGLAKLDGLFSVFLFGYFFWVRIVMGQGPLETFQGFAGNFFLGGYLLFTAIGQLQIFVDRFGTLANKRKQFKHRNPTFAGD